MIQVKNWGNGQWGAGMNTPPRQLNLGGGAAPAPAPSSSSGSSSGMSYQVGVSPSLKPAFNADSQKAMIERLFGAQGDKLRTGAHDQAERLALRSGMSVNGGQAVTTENEILQPQMQDLELAQMQAMLGVDHDAAQMSLQERQFQADQDRWKAEQAFQERQYGDQLKQQQQQMNQGGGGGVSGGPIVRRALNALDGGPGGGGQYGSKVIGGAPGFSPQEMADGGQLLSNQPGATPKPKDRVFLSDKPSAIRAPGQLAPAPTPSNAPLPGVASLNSFNTQNAGRNTGRLA